MRKLKAYLILFFYLCCNTFIAQNEVIDSLKNILFHAKHDTLRCPLLNEIGVRFINLMPDSAPSYFIKSIELAELQLKTESNSVVRKNLISSKAEALCDYGNYFIATNNSEKGLSFFKKSAQFSEDNYDKHRMANAYIFIATEYSKQGNITEALNMYRKSLKIYENEYKTSGKGDELGYCLLCIGNIYSDQKDLKAAFDLYNRSLQVYTKTNLKIGKALALEKISGIYSEFGDPNCKMQLAECKKNGIKKALEGYLMLLQIWKEEKVSRAEGRIALNIASIYKKLGNLKESSIYVEMALQIFEKIDFKLGIARVMRAKADLASKQGQTNLALQYAKKSMSLSKENGYPDDIMSSSKSLKQIYEVQKNYKGALEMYELFIQMRDSINNDETRKASIKNQFQIEYEHKADEDSLLNALKIKEERFRGEQKIANQKIYTLVSSIGFILLLMITIVSIRAYRNKQKANQLIAEQMQQIETNNKDLKRQHLLNQKIFSVISHDFRGPILSLNLVINKFKKDTENAKLSNYLHDTGVAVNNANEVLNNLLNWAKTEINISNVDKAESNVHDVTTAIKKEFDVKLNEKQISIEDLVPSQTLIGLPQDILLIVLRNLVSNAIKYSSIGSKIEIAYPTENVISVRDFGKGMNTETLDKLFKQQVNSETGTNREQGFGIGLYIISELLHKYNHMITVESSPNEGSCFFIKPNLKN